MKSWQLILINACVTIAAVFVGMGLFAPDPPPQKAERFEEALNTAVEKIQTKLASIEEAIQKKGEKAVIAREPVGTKESSERLIRLNQKLDMILGKLTLLENKEAVLQRPQTFGRSFAPPMALRQMPESGGSAGVGGSPTQWLDSLPEERREEVQRVFEEHALRMRDKLPPPGSDGQLPDRETMIQAMKENDLILKQELKSVLTDEEYDLFLNSHPNPGESPPALPGIQRPPVNQ